MGDVPHMEIEHHPQAGLALPMTRTQSSQIKPEFV